MRRCATSACAWLCADSLLKARAFSTTRFSQQRISINDLLKSTSPIDNVQVHGWVRHVRKQKKVAFAHISDGHSIVPLQAVLPPEEAKDLSIGAAVSLTGRWAESPGKGQGFELQAQQCAVLGENDATSNPLQPKYQTVEYLRTIPQLRSRLPTGGLILRLRSALIASITRFFGEQGFVQTHTPIITSSDCEGAGEVFTVSTGDGVRKANEQGDGSAEHFFRTPKYLTVSAQLHLEALAQAVDKVWTLSPTFRAEKSDTARHLSEFYMLEAEMCFTNDLNDVMSLVESMLRFAARDLMQSGLLEQLATVYGKPHTSEEGDSAGAEPGHISPALLKSRWQGMSASHWPRIPYHEAMELLKSEVAAGRASFDLAVSDEHGLQTEHEKYLAPLLGQGKPVFITHYPRNQKPFYMPASVSTGTTPDTVECFDLLVPDLCELVGGSLREHRLDELRKRMVDTGVSGDNLEWYLDLRKYGSVPHGGFGLGFDRLLCYLGGVNSIRDVVAFPRWYGRADC